MRAVMRVLASFAVVLLVVAASIYLMSQRRIERTYDVPVVSVRTGTDPEVLERGKHVAEIRGCMDCHGPDLGGVTFADAMPVMRLTASNLTSGRNGVGELYSDEDWVRAIRSGVRPDGSPLLYMPSFEYRALGPDDLGALISWIRTRPPVDSEPLRQAVGPLGRLLFLTGELPLISAELIDHEDLSFAQPPSGVTPEFGAYIASSCIGCHGAGMSGGPIPGGPPDWPQAANITTDRETGIGDWTAADFEAFANSGVRPDGSSVDPLMPWPALRAMTDVERSALWSYLRTLPPRPEGGR
jgi:mono/diheme cytochrome c family protein